MEIKGRQYYEIIKIIDMKIIQQQKMLILH